MWKKFQGQDNAAVFDNLGARKLKNELLSSSEEISYKIRTGEDNEGLICQALLTGNIESAVELCIESNRMADAIIIASTGGSDLLARTQYRYLKSSQGYLSNIISALVTDDWSSVVSQCSTESWKEALVATLTYCREHVPVLCERLGERLQTESGNNLIAIQNAILCYICAGNVERLAESWLTIKSTTDATNTDAPSTKELQDLIEVVILFQKALELQGRNISATGKLAELLSQYAGLLASQGALSSALTYLGPSEAVDIVELRERLYYTLGHKQAYVSNVRSQSQAQNIYAKAPTPNKFGQRSSIGSIQPPQPIGAFNNSFNTNNFNAGFSSAAAPAADLTPPMWSNPVPTHPQAQPQWNSTPFAPHNVAQSNPILPPVQSKPPPVQPPLLDPSAQPPRPSSVSSQGTPHYTHLY